MRFAVSGVSDPAVWLAIDDSLEFKLDVSASWDEPLMRNYAETGRVRVLDFKAYYEATQVESIDDPEEYALVVSIFPDAVLEDAALNDETRPVLAGALERLSFDAPIHSLADVHALGVSPQHLNIKPSRFGTIERLFDCVDWCLANDVSMYGGGQFELGIGREQIQAFASLFYPDAANDVAPGDYNTATEPRAGLAGNPLAVPRRSPASRSRRERAAALTGQAADFEQGLARGALLDGARHLARGNHYAAYRRLKQAEAAVDRATRDGSAASSTPPSPASNWQMATREAPSDSWCEPACGWPKALQSSLRSTSTTCSHASLSASSRAHRMRRRSCRGACRAYGRRRRGVSGPTASARTRAPSARLRAPSGAPRPSPSPCSGARVGPGFPRERAFARSSRSFIVSSSPSSDSICTPVLASSARIRRQRPTPATTSRTSAGTAMPSETARQIQTQMGTARW